MQWPKCTGGKSILLPQTSRQKYTLASNFKLGGKSILQSRESKRSDENSKIFPLTCNQFPHLSMVPYHITIKMVLSLKIFKSFKMYNQKSVRALFSAPNHFLHLFFQLYQFEEKRIRRLKAVYIHTIQHLSITLLRSNVS